MEAVTGDGHHMRWLPSMRHVAAIAIVFALYGAASAQTPPAIAPAQKAAANDGSPLVAADVSHLIGISNPFLALLIAGSTVLAAFAVLTLICHRRLKRLGYGDLDPIIRIITSPDGYASLSRLQMVLWTFVVAASAVYVMVLSGELIEVTTGTLVLLGISGAVTVGSKLHDSVQAAKMPSNGASPVQRKPRWSDLIVNDVDGSREIDISRV